MQSISPGSHKTNLSNFIFVHNKNKHALPATTASFSKLKMKLPLHTPQKYMNDEQNRNQPPTVPDDGHGVGGFTRSFDDKLWMFHRRWDPTTPSAAQQQRPAVQATLMIVHGTVDHSGQYHQLATKLSQEAGIAVIALDMRGWGRSDGESMYIDDMETFCADVDALYQHVHKRDDLKDVRARFLLGKSLGGTVTAACVQKYPQHWTGLLGLSGAYELEPSIGQPNIFKWTLLKSLAYVAPKFPFKRLFDERLIVSDDEALEEWRKDELCCKDKVRVGYAINIIEGVQQIPQMKFNLPMLMMCGDADQVVLPSGHEMMLKLNDHQDKVCKFYAGGYHNLLMEPKLKDQVMQDIVEWIVSHSST